MEFIDYLWGIETTWTSSGGAGNTRFIDYLWGIETLPPPLTLDIILLFIDYLWGIETRTYVRDKNAVDEVYRLPMRNWNSNSFAIILQTCPFIDYLWGIETRLKRIFTCSFIRVYRLPMRNWNRGEPFLLEPWQKVYRLPIRNWNYHFIVTTSILFLSL